MAVAMRTQVPHTRPTSAATAKVIPAFGNWDSYGAGDDGEGIPITQYFESARAAGLRRGQCPSSFRKDQQQSYSCCHQLPPYLRSYHYQYCNQKRMMMAMMRDTGTHEDLWWEQRRARQSEEGPLMYIPQPQQQQQQKQRRRSHNCNYEPASAAAPPAAARKQALQVSTGRTTPAVRFMPAAAKNKKKKIAAVAVRPAGGRPPKAVDEDLYKIPPELLRLHQRAATRRRSILRAWRCIGLHCVE